MCTPLLNYLGLKIRDPYAQGLQGGQVCEWDSLLALEYSHYSEISLGFWRVGWARWRFSSWNCILQSSPKRCHSLRLFHECLAQYSTSGSVVIVWNGKRADRFSCSYHHVKCLSDIDRLYLSASLLRVAPAVSQHYYFSLVICPKDWYLNLFSYRFFWLVDPSLPNSSSYLKEDHLGATKESMTQCLSFWEPFEQANSSLREDITAFCLPKTLSVELRCFY